MGYQKSKGEWRDSAAQPAIPTGDHSGTEAKGKMTGESTCHPWHPLLAGCSSLLSSVSLLPARRAQFKARHIFLFSLSYCVNKKQISPLSCDHEPGSYNLFSGASLGWQEWSAGKLCLLTPPFVWQKVSSHLPSPNSVPATLITAWKTGSNHNDHLKNVSQTLHILPGFSPGFIRY